MTKIWAAFVTVPALLVGCVPAPQSPQPVPEAQECDAAPAQGFVGKLSTPERNVEIQRLTGARNLRWIGPNMAVTMDYRTDRVNVHYDDNKFVTQITCG